jgi:hypothetical protein
MKGRKAHVDSGGTHSQRLRRCCCIPVPHHAFLLTASSVADDLSAECVRFYWLQKRLDRRRRRRRRKEEKLLGARIRELGFQKC